MQTSARILQLSVEKVQAGRGESSRRARLKVFEEDRSFRHFGCQIQAVSGPKSTEQNEFAKEHPATGRGWPSVLDFLWFNCDKFWRLAD
jgi:hypothetical protein